MSKRADRLSLDVADWPVRDRAAWVAARQPAGPLDDGGLAAGWSAKTVRQSEKGYGLWLGCLTRHGRLDPDVTPGARLTRETLTLFGHELLTRVAPQTAASRVRDLSVMIRVLDPEADRSLVKRMQATLTRRAPPSRAKRERMIAPALLFAAGLRPNSALRRRPPRTGTCAPRRIGASSICRIWEIPDQEILAWIPTISSRLVRSYHRPSARFPTITRSRML